MTYQQQIKDPRWQKKRLQVLNLHKFQCQECGSKSEELHVHHPFYKRGAMIWEYDKKELQCLCHRCHKNAHEIDEKIRKALALCRDKQSVLEHICRINSAEATINYKPAKVKREPSVSGMEDFCYSKHMARLAQEEEMELRQIYARHPDLAPQPGDTEDVAANKFFEKMKLMLG